MGFSHSVYVGPYLYCSVRTKPVTKRVKGRVQSEISSFTLNELTNERLSEYNGSDADDGVHLFIPNQDWPRSFDVDQQVGEVLRVSPSTRDDELRWFETNFQDAIAKAVELYGPDMVVVRWGVLGQYS